VAVINLIIRSKKTKKAHSNLPDSLQIPPRLAYTPANKYPADYASLD
jgi:hypothetical protein